jgi:hypothetical protein
VINGFQGGTEQPRLFDYPATDATPTFINENAVFSLSDGTQMTLMGVTSLAPNPMV